MRSVEWLSYSEVGWASEIRCCRLNLVGTGWESKQGATSEDQKQQRRLHLPHPSPRHVHASIWTLQQKLAWLLFMIIWNLLRILAQECLCMRCAKNTFFFLSHNHVYAGNDPLYLSRGLITCRGWLECPNGPGKIKSGPCDWRPDCYKFHRVF